MKQIIIISLLVTLFCGVLLADPGIPLFKNPIRIVHPVENAHLPALDSTFVFGSAPPDGALFINGEPVSIHPGGGFLTMVKLAPGEFKIEAELQLGNRSYHSTRNIVVDGPEQPAPVSPLTIEYVTPRQDQELLPGDYVDVVCKGSPGKEAYFTIKGLRKKFPMTESGNAPGGIYHGVYKIENNDRLNKSEIKVTLVGRNNQKKSKEAPGTISLFPNEIPVMVETLPHTTVLRAGPALTGNDQAGYLMFPPAGTLLQVTGRKGDEYRVRLNKSKTVWVSADHVKKLPKGTQQALIVAGNISLSVNDNSTLIRIPLGRKIPFKIDNDVEGTYLDISFFGAFSNTDRIANAAIGAVKQIKWFQDDEETYRLRVYTAANGWWGYDARYEDNQFLFELRTPPPVSNDSPLLNGLTIAVDPGHSADTGAVGPTGYAEKDANLAMAHNLKEKLTAQGAKVIMIRDGNQDVPLSQRPLIAWQNRADLLISLHNNALAYGGNPLLKHGFSVYYYTPMSLPLATEVHKAYKETFGNPSPFNLQDDGLYYGNLALTRAPQMPSILIESAYMIVPEEEAYLKTESFRSVCSEAIITGLERYLKQMRPVVK